MEKEKAALLQRVVLTAAVVLVTVFIFDRSMQDADSSNMESAQMMTLVQGVLQWLGQAGISMRGLRKLAHWAEFALLGALSEWCLRAYTPRYVRFCGMPLLSGLLTALTDETIQRFIPGRSSSVADVWLDFFGVCCGTAAAVGALLLREKMQQIKNREEKKNDGRSGH